MIRKEVFLFFVLCPCVTPVIAQEKSDVELRPVEVIDSLESSVRQLSAISFDSLEALEFAGYDAGDLLNSHSTAFVKDYGPGSASVLSYRGGTAYHTKVYWEGISIDDPMLGQQDLSLIQPGEFMSLQFYRGGHSLNLGTGGFGGILNIEQGSAGWQGAHTRLSQSYGSFNTRRSQLDVLAGNGKVKFESSLSYVSSDNDYPYLNYIRSGNYEKRENAAYRKVQWMPKLSFRTGSHELFVSYWHSVSARQIPSAVGTAHGDAGQDDVWNRAMAGWQLRRSKWKLEVTTALLEDDLNYDNRLLDIVSRNKTQASRSVAAVNIHLSPKWTSGTQFKHDHTLAKSSNYLLIPVRDETEIFESLNYHSDHFLMTAKIRYYRVTHKSADLLPALLVRYLFKRKQRESGLFISLARNVRYPSFNELYWQTTQAVPVDEERSWNSEAGISISNKKNKVWEYSSQATGFYGTFNNLILWLPDNTGTWRPQNQKDAVNYGMELEGRLACNIGSWKIEVSGGYGYTASMVRDKNETEAERRQQIYTPRHKSHYTIRTAWRSFFAGYHQVHTDKIFITTDHTTFLPGSHPAGIEFGMIRNIKRLSTTLKMEVKNIFSENYQYVANMPMPLRHYCLTLILNYNQ